MSLSWIDRLHTHRHLDLYIGDAQLQWADHQARQPPQLSAQALANLQLSSVLHAIAHGLEKYEVNNRVRLNVVLGLNWCRHLMLPWDARLVNTGLAAAMAKAIFERRFAEPVQGYQLVLAQANYLKPQVATFVPIELLEGLKRLIDAKGMKLGRVEPLLAAVWNRLPALPGDAGTVVVLENSRALEVRVQTGNPESIGVRPCANVNDLLHTANAASTYVFAPGRAVPAPLTELTVEVGESPDLFGYVLCAGAH